MLNPLSTTDTIRDTYFRYITTAYPISDPDLGQQFEEHLRHREKFVKGPLLEVTPAFQTMHSIDELIKEGLVSSEFRKLQTPSLPTDRPLYTHQETALRRVKEQNRNIVVATGTGSGKTESFLLPILDHLFEEHTNRTLSPGIRALLLYPMNALANDQMKRLRHLLINYPHITFGRYTGETEETEQRAVDKFRKNFPKEPRIPNELLSREQMRQTPPHILLTNYAMLEYLLLRPQDAELFDGANGKHWKFIVLDEAHTYDGAKGIEIGMLLRRLRERTLNSQKGRLRCIATSATVGKDDGNRDNTFAEIARFASNLFDESFEWTPEMEDRQDVIIGLRKTQHGPKECWGKPKPSFYQRIFELLDQEDTPAISNFKPICVEEGAPDKLVEQLAKQYKTPQGFLFHLMRGDGNLHDLHDKLSERPYALADLESLFPGLDTREAQTALLYLVELANKLRTDSEQLPLISARYHLFVRALEGAYLSFAPKRQLFLDPQETLLVDDKQYPVFEMCSCRRCGSLYLVGMTEDNGSSQKFVQHASLSEDGTDDTEFYLVLPSEDQQLDADEDELVTSGEDEDQLVERYNLCVECASLQPTNSLLPACGCNRYPKQHLLRVNTRNGRVSGCAPCGTRGSVTVGRFLLGQDAPVSVLAASLYQSLPESDVDSNQDEQAEDEWLSSPEENKVKGRQLLLFSDSRQEAAFFACYMGQTYNQILRRRLINLTLAENHSDAIMNQWRLKDLVEPVKKKAEEFDLFLKTDSPQDKLNKVWKWLLMEFMAYDKRNSLEGLGCLAFELEKPSRWAPPPPLLKAPWNLTADEVWTLHQVLLDTLRFQGAVLFPNSVDPKDRDFAPRNRPYYFRRDGSAPKSGVMSWNSAGGSLNRRLDILQKLVERINSKELTKVSAKEVLNKLWDVFTSDRSVWRDYFFEPTVSGEGVVYQLRHDYWKLAFDGSRPEIAWYKCDKCSTLTLHNLRGICTVYRCSGTVKKCDPVDAYKGNHYRDLYEHLHPLPLVAEEHTAQLTSTAASELQDKFVRGEVNLLSCSTTFELGVDVGELQAVLMRNVPPSTSNYIQRAGRAGRRKDSTAFVLTFARRRSHDLTYFAHPEEMVGGKIRPPHFEIRNEKIVRRHVHATALSWFWKRNEDLFGTVEKFFFPAGNSGPELLKNFLNQRPDELRECLRRIVPSNLLAELGIQDWTWLPKLIDDTEGILFCAADDVRSDVEDLEGVRVDLVAENKQSDFILRMINTLKRRRIIDFLSTHNVIPKYGFPVDVVELRLAHHGEEARRLNLERDLRIALSEYAPESEVVAGGKLWVSDRLKRLPKRDWPRYNYAICKHCMRYQRFLSATAPKFDDCISCKNPLDGKGVKGTFIVPEFGFVSNSAPRQPDEAQPKRTYVTRVYFSGETAEIEKKVDLPLDYVTLSASAARDGQLAVINRAKFKVCHSCGFAVRGNRQTRGPHHTAAGKECKGTLHFEDLGYEFKTDVLDIRLSGVQRTNRSFWLSLLYALLEGASEALYVTRNDLNGCLYPFSEDPNEQAIILFDDVPGGAGHVMRLVESEDLMISMLDHARAKVDNSCGCAPDTSCYGCLRNYRNQYCHDDLKRGQVLDFLTRELSRRKAVPVS